MVRGCGSFCVVLLGGLAMLHQELLPEVAGPAATPGALDPACFSQLSGRTYQRCCGLVESECDFPYLFTPSYCCNLTPECYGWGVVIHGSDLGPPRKAESGILCRHYCQAEPSCQAWTFVTDSHPLAELHRLCFLKSRLWHDSELRAPGQLGFLAGPRHCPPNQTTVLSSLAPRRGATGHHRGDRTLDDAEDSAVVSPHQDGASYVARAAHAVREEGWAVVKGAITGDEAAALAEATAGAAEALLARDRHRVGNRGPRRYSLGDASKTRNMVHVPAYAKLIDAPSVTPVLQELFRGDYLLVGGGGDLVLGDTDSLQHLHADTLAAGVVRFDAHATPPTIAVNFAVHNVTCTGGPMRIYPGTHKLPLRVERVDKVLGIPAHLEAAELGRRGLARLHLCPLARGDAVIRDLRLWHAGSANLESTTRSLPNLEFSAPWWAHSPAGGMDYLALRPSLPDELWRGLSPHGQKISAGIRALEEEVDRGIKDVPFWALSHFPWL